MSSSSFLYDFTTIRPWNGSQHRAFEELSYQLLKDDVPAGSNVRRSGNPDGGVEWSAHLPSGEQWGWQAKYIREIGSLLTAMTESVNRVVLERPTLTKLHFVIPFNLPEGTRGGRTNSARHRYEETVQRWKRTIPGASQIEFELIQESTLLDILARPEHRGRQWFWWQHASFDQGWAGCFFEQQAEIAGKKYRPDLLVDLPIRDDLDGLGLSNALVEHYGTLRKELHKAATGARPADHPSPGIHDQWDEILATVGTVGDLIANEEPFLRALHHFDALEATLDTCATRLDELEHQSFRERDKTEPKNWGQSEDRSLYDAWNRLIGAIRTISGPAEAMLRWLRSTPVQAARQGNYFLVGAAGSGKTHLFLDAARVGLDDGRLAVVLHGIQFHGDLWSSMSDQLGLGTLARDVLLTAMDSAAEASAIQPSRFLVLIDAINETTEPGYWEAFLPVLRVAFARFPHLALAVSCRDTFLDVVDPHRERERFEVVTHPGFAGREIEATQKYFDHFHLELPRIPLLTPEFTVPLFLRLYCEGLAESGISAAVGHEGRVTIFERYLSAKLDSVARRSFPPATSNLIVQRNRHSVEFALNALLDALAMASGYALAANDGIAAITSAPGWDHDRAEAVIGVLEDEGIIVQEPHYVNPGRYETGIRVTFQAFSEFLLLERRLATSVDPLEDADLRTWLRDDANWGIVEAATIVFPERFGVELSDYLGFDIVDTRWNANATDEEHRRTNRARSLYGSQVDMLPYRSSHAVTNRTVELLNQAWKSPDVSVSIWHLLYTLAPQTENPLNAKALHAYLKRMKMADRDAFYGEAVYWALDDESHPITRLARWAEHGPYPSYPDEVIEHSAVAVAWMLSSANRFARDWITKALVQLLHGHLPVMLKLLEIFWHVDDPYVVQRVVTVAYGCLMRGGLSSPDSAKAIAEWASTTVFSRPIRADELMLDSARGIVEWAVWHDLLPESELEQTKRPFGLKVPGNPPSEEWIQEKYGYREGVARHESYVTVYWSLFGMADFAKYVVSSRFGRFSRIRIGRPMPKRQEPRRRFFRSRWKRFVESLTPEQQRFLADELKKPDGGQVLYERFDESSPLSSVTEEQWRLMSSAWEVSYPRRDIGYSTDFACRWIFMRVLSLGWTPERFGMTDSYLAHRDQGRSEHKPERWGKKYQWVALHELLARVADNYQAYDRFGDGDEPYGGMQQYIGGRDIDPCLPPVSYRNFQERRREGAPTWRPAPVAIRTTPFPELSRSAYHGDIRRFLNDRETIPTPNRSVFARDADGALWIAVKSAQHWTERPRDWDHPRLSQTAKIGSCLVASADARSAAYRLAAAWKDHWYEFDHHGHVDCCYAGELAWSRRPCERKLRSPNYVGDGDNKTEVDFLWDTYAWESGILDCSIEDSVAASLIAGGILQSEGLMMSCDGPSWRTSGGQLVAVYREALTNQDGYESSLYIKATWLNSYLDRHPNVTLVLLTYYERILLESHRTWEHPNETGWLSGLYMPHSRSLEICSELIKQEGLTSS